MKNKKELYTKETVMWAYDVGVVLGLIIALLTTTGLFYLVI